MPPSPYFKQLAEEFEGHPYKDRLLEELENHLEDMKEEKVTERECNDRMGHPKEIKDVFLKIMHPFGKLLFFMEGFFYGIAILPMNLGAYLYLAKLSNTLAHSFFPLLTTYLGLFLIYVALFKRYIKLRSTTNQKLFWWIIAITLPSFLWIVLGISVII